MSGGGKKQNKGTNGEKRGRKERPAVVNSLETAFLIGFSKNIRCRSWNYLYFDVFLDTLTKVKMLVRQWRAQAVMVGVIDNLLIGRFGYHSTIEKTTLLSITY